VGQDKDILLAKTFTQAWAQQGGRIPTKHTASQYGYEVSSPFPVHGMNFSIPLKAISINDVIPSRQRLRELTATNQWYESANAAFYRCISDLERFAHRARYS